jgi:hypothetical protein
MIPPLETNVPLPIGVEAMVNWSATPKWAPLPMVMVASPPGTRSPVVVANPPPRNSRPVLIVPALRLITPVAFSPPARLPAATIAESDPTPLGMALTEELAPLTSSVASDPTS